LLVIPIGQSNLYVEPVYLQARESPIPELTRVAVSTGRRVVMEPTLEEALIRLFAPGTAAPAQPGAQPPPATPGTAGPTPLPASPGVPLTVQQLAAEAQDHYSRAQEALRTGDFARYGDEQRALEDTINRLVQATR
jgi:uncharacterized membrane protein (UPF0182 family)